jgi:hypothetical protein
VCIFGASSYSGEAAAAAADSLEERATDSGEECPVADLVEGAAAHRVKVGIAAAVGAVRAGIVAAVGAVRAGIVAAVGAIRARRTPSAWLRGA